MVRRNLCSGGEEGQTPALIELPDCLIERQWEEGRFRASDRSRGRESYTAGHGLFGLPVVLAGADWLVELSASFARHSPAFSALP